MSIELDPTTNFLQNKTSSLEFYQEAILITNIQLYTHLD